MYVVFLAVMRYLFSMPYMQLEGFTRALHRLIPRLLKDASMNRDVIKAFMDGAYIYNTLINMQTR
jgi:hypothetical protein